MAPSVSVDKAAPKPKRRKLSFHTVRNGGSTDSFIPPDALAFAADAGSDTEEEDNTVLEEEFLNRMTDDTDKKVETVFGKDIEVWKSHGGTVYADINDKVKRKMREQELWGDDQKAKVHVGSKRKAEDITLSFKEEDDCGSVINKDKSKKKGGKKATPIPTPPPTSPYPPRSPSATIFHRSSAGINPSGAHARPLKPLPKRSTAHTSATPSIFSGLGHVNMEGKTHTSTQQGTAAGFRHDVDASQLPPRLPAYLHGRSANQHPARLALDPRPRSRIVSGSFGSFEGGVTGRFDERPYRLLPKPGVHLRTRVELEEEREDAVAMVLPSQSPAPTDTRSNRLVSGSFGSFDEGAPSRFDESPYRLLPGQLHDDEGEEMLEKKPNPFKGKPWLR